MIPYKSKKDEIVAKSLVIAKNNMKKMNHPLTGFLMGDEGSSYAVQLNDTKSTPPEIMAEKQDELSKHNNTVKGAIVKFVKHSHLFEKDSKATKKVENPLEDKKEVKKEDKKEEKHVEKKEEKKEV